MRTPLTHNMTKHTLLLAIPILTMLLLTMSAFYGIALAQSGLTTIQDTLFRADGSRFSGTLTIQWSTFDSAGTGTVVQQSRTIQVLNGNLQVQLVPNAAAPSPANVYIVQYQSDGYQQFAEKWTVPQSALPLTVAQVRTGSGSITATNSTGSSAANQTPITEAAVIGLLSDLAQRPVKGPGFGTGSVAVINQNGQIETAVGNLGDCMFIDGSSGPCGAPASTFSDAEIPGGAIDGVNTTFTLQNAPSGTSLMLFRNGLYMLAGSDYTLTGSTIQFASGATPQVLDSLVASYRIDPDSSNIGNLNGSPGHASTNAQVLCSAGGQTNKTASSLSLGSCDIPAVELKTGDRIEVRFTFTHTGTASAWDATLLWGGTAVLARHGSTQDAALAGQADASVTASGSQITVQSWGTLLPLLPGIVTAPALSGVKVDLRAALTTAGIDTLGLANFTVLRYPGH